jgi:hypothetical protein
MRRDEARLPGPEGGEWMTISLRAATNIISKSRCGQGMMSVIIHPAGADYGRGTGRNATPAAKHHLMMPLSCSSS